MFHVSDFWRLIIMSLKYGLIPLSILLVISFYFYLHYFHIRCNYSYSKRVLLSLIILPFIASFSFFSLNRLFMFLSMFSFSDWHSFHMFWFMISVGFKKTHNLVSNTNHSFLWAQECS